MGATPPSGATRRAELTATVCDVLGELAYLAAELESSEPLAGSTWLHGSVRYRVPGAEPGSPAPGGTLECWCTRRLAVQLTANLLGLEPEAEAARAGAADALREFMNVLCSQLITRRHGSQALFDLGIPVVRQCAAPPAATTSADRQWCRLTVEGEPLLCAYRAGG